MYHMQKEYRGPLSHDHNSHSTGIYQEWCCAAYGGKMAQKTYLWL